MGVKAPRNRQKLAVFENLAELPQPVVKWSGAMAWVRDDGDATSASLTFLLADNPNEGDTIAIGDIVYTFVDALSDPAVPYEVVIGDTADDTLNNLEAAINAGAGEETAYSVGTVANPYVSAANVGEENMTLTSKQTGLSGNGLPVLYDVDGTEEEYELSAGLDSPVIVVGKADGLGWFTFKPDDEYDPEPPIEE